MEVRICIALLWVACLSYSSSCHAQYFNFTDIIDSTTWHSPNVYPHFTSKRVPSVADSINRSFVEQVPGILPDMDFAGSYLNMGYFVSRNDDRVLNILINYEVCAAYCELYDESYSFDSKTGRPILPENIFLTEGETLIMDSVRRMKNSRINIFLKDSFENYIAADSNLQPDREIIYDLYTQCLDTTLNAKEIYPLQLEIDEKTFTITLERCFPHVLRAADILWEYRYEFLAKNWKDYLTPYGKRIFKL